MDPTTEIASNFTVADYDYLRNLLDPANPQAPAWEDIIKVFKQRIDERFISPVARLMGRDRSSSPTKSVPGFAILALDCLLIDTIQSFREGRVKTGEVSPAQSFKNFLNSKSKRFRSFKPKDRSDFFDYVRNGLLHNGETRGNWKVRADNTEMLTKDEHGTRIINRSLFHQAIVEEFEQYCGQLLSAPADFREKFLRRMDAICGHSLKPGRYYFAYGSMLLDTEIQGTAPDAEAVSAAYLPGWRLTFDKHSTTRQCDAASIEKCPSQMVWGYVYRVSAKDEENITQREAGYEKKDLTVLLVDDVSDCENCTPADAFTFIGEKVCPDACGASEEYLDIILKGAKLRGLPDDYIQRIQSLKGRISMERKRTLL